MGVRARVLAVDLAGLGGRDGQHFELIRVEAPQWVAGLILADDRCVRAAPILRWTVNLRRQQIKDSFERKGWKATVVSRWEGASP